MLCAVMNDSSRVTYGTCILPKEIKKNLMALLAKL